ncbi:MAG TPA: hypothetical protein VIR61_08385 [Sulfuricaulis sp.]
MKKIFLILFLVFSVNSFAASLQSADSKLIKAAGIPLFSKATFVYGNKDVGFRFASSASPEEVQKWYRQQLPKWALLKEYGGWILYNGAPGVDMGEVMSKNQVSVKHNDNLPQWHSLDKKMTTEIVIMIVN